jgi:sialidase-1
MTGSTSRRAALLLFVICLIVPAWTGGVGMVGAQTQSSGQVVGEPVLEFSTPSPELTPGTTSELEIQLTNRGRLDKGGPSQYESRVTTARGLLLEVDSGNSPIEIQSGPIAVGDVSTGAQSTGPITLTVPEDIEPGTYQLPIEYSYQFTRIAEYSAVGVEYNDITRTQSATLEVEVTDRARFEITGVTSDAQIGDRGEVAVTLENVGNQIARDASVSATSRTSLVTFDGEAAESTAFVGDWEPGASRTVTYNTAIAADAINRSYTLDLSVDFVDPDGISKQSEPMAAGIATAPEQSFVFADVASDLRVGEDGTIAGTVENTGPEPAKSVVIRYDDDAQTLTPIEEAVAVGTLNPGESASFELPIEVNSEAEAGAKSVDFAVRYRNADNDRRVYEKLDIRADVAPERDQFGVALANQTIEAGSSRTITVEVTNNLDETVTDVEGRLFAKDPLDTGQADTGYVQSIDPGETVAVTFDLSAAGSATPAKTYSISFDFRYDDEDGNSKLSDTVRVPIEVTESEEGGLPIRLIAIAVAVLAIGGFLWYRRQ